MGSYVKVTNLRNGRAVVVRVNDRGPIVPGRIIDLSYGAAQALQFKHRGLQRVRLDVVSNSASDRPEDHLPDRCRKPSSASETSVNRINWLGCLASCPASRTVASSYRGDRCAKVAREPKDDEPAPAAHRGVGCFHRRRGKEDCRGGGRLRADLQSWHAALYRRRAADGAGSGRFPGGVFFSI